MAVTLSPENLKLPRTWRMPPKLNSTSVSSNVNTGVLGSFTVSVVEPIVTVSLMSVLVVLNETPTVAPAVKPPMLPSMRPLIVPATPVLAPE